MRGQRRKGKSPCKKWREPKNSLHLDACVLPMSWPLLERAQGPVIAQTSCKVRHLSSAVLIAGTSPVQCFCWEAVRWSVSDSHQTVQLCPPQGLCPSFRVQLPWKTILHLIPRIPAGPSLLMLIRWEREKEEEEKEEKQSCGKMGCGESRNLWELKPQVPFLRGLRKVWLLGLQLHLASGSVRWTLLSMWILNQQGYAALTGSQTVALWLILVYTFNMQLQKSLLSFCLNRSGHILWSVHLN